MSVGRRRFTAAFEAPGYRWLWLKSLSTAAAYTIENLSVGWLVLQLTNSPFWLGVAVAMRGISQALLSVPAGLAADRLDRRALLIVAQTIAGLGALVLAYLILSAKIALWHVLIYMVLAGAMFSTNSPATNGLVYDVVGEARLLNASAFQFMASSIVRIAGALAGGIIIDRLGVGRNYLLIAVVNAGGVACLAALRSPAARRRASEAFGRAVAEGVRYVLRTPRIRRLLLLSLTIEGFGFSTFSLLPFMARDVLHVGGAGLGDLAAMSGVGQLAATLLIASRVEQEHLGTVLMGAAFGFGVCIIAFSSSPWFGLSLGLIAVVGLMGSAYDATIAASFQLGVTDEMRGRVLGFYSATFGLNALGATCIGAVATITGTPIALGLSGAAVMASAFALSRGAVALIRPGPARSC